MKERIFVVKSPEQIEEIRRLKEIRKRNELYFYIRCQELLLTPLKNIPLDDLYALSDFWRQIVHGLHKGMYQEYFNNYWVNIVKKYYNWNELIKVDKRIENEN